MLIKTIGKIDETGYLKSFKRQGFTPAKCILELVANSLDSLDTFENKCIHFEVSSNIKMIDNGIGMNGEGVENMFALHRENHTSDKSRGVSGYGAKVSLSILSEEKNMLLFTHKKNQPYIKVSIPWQEIHKKGQYTGMIEVSEMDDTERIEFCEERLQNSMIDEEEEPTGTTIVFPRNTTLENVIRDNFLLFEDGDDVQMKPFDRISIVFGREENLQITYISPEEGFRMLELYNYFGGRNTDYWGGIARETVELWIHKEESRFLWRQKDGTSLEVHKKGRGYDRSADLTRKNTKNFTHIGDYEVLVGLRKQANIDPKNITGSKKVGEYDYRFLGDKEDEYLGCHKLVRNGQGIGLIPSEVKIANARANSEQNLEIFLVQCDVNFSPTSAQDNKQDQITGIQQNKNQFDGGSLPKNFTRLIHHIKMRKSKDILESFKKEEEVQQEELYEEVVDQEEAHQEETHQEEVVHQEETQQEEAHQEVVQQEEAQQDEIQQENQQEEVKEEETHQEEVVHQEETQQEEAHQEVVQQEEAQQDETQQEIQQEDLHQNQQRPNIPIEVPAHRKGGFIGHELRNELILLHETLNENIFYEEKELIEIFNKLRNYRLRV